MHPKDLLNRWLQAHQAQFQEAGIEFSHEEAVFGGSALIDFTSRSSFGRIAVGAEGYCDAEALDFETGKSLYYRHLEEITPNSFAALMNELLERLSRADP